MKIHSKLGESIQKVIEQALIRDGYTNPLVIFKHRNGPEPKRSYVAIHLLGIQAEGRATKSSALEEVVVNGVEKGRYYSHQHYTATVQLTCIGEDSGDIATSLKTALSGSPAMRDSFVSENLVLRSHGDIRANPQLRESKWVDTFNMDVVLGYSVNATEDVDWVAAITVNGVQIPETI